MDLAAEMELGELGVASREVEGLLAWVVKLEARPVLGVDDGVGRPQAPLVRSCCSSCSHWLSCSRSPEAVLGALDASPLGGRASQMEDALHHF